MSKNTAIDIEVDVNATGFTLNGGNNPSSLEVAGSQPVKFTGDSSQKICNYPTSADHYVVAAAAAGSSGQIPVKDASDLVVYTSLLAQYTSYAAGTVYTMTASAAQIAFGTTSPQVTLDAGTWIIFAYARLDAAGATYAGNQLATVKLRRTNNTAADLTNASTGFNMPIITTITQTLGHLHIPNVIYTATQGDIIQLYGLVAATPAAGSITVNEAQIVAIRIA